MSTSKSTASSTIAKREHAQRNAELAKIHIAKKRLGLSDDDYRGMLRELTGCESSRDLSAEERSRVIDAMKQKLLGPPLGSRPSAAVEPQLNLIKSLWANLALYGIVRDASEKALTRFARRITKIDSLRWLSATDASKVIGAMHSMLERGKAR